MDTEIKNFSEAVLTNFKIVISKIAYSLRQIVGPFQDAAFALPVSTLANPVYTDPPIKTILAIILLFFKYTHLGWIKTLETNKYKQDSKENLILELTVLYYNTIFISTSTFIII